MAVLRRKTKAKKAQLEASAAAAEARQAAQDSAAAVRDLAVAVLAQIKDLGLDEKAGQALGKVKASDAYGRAQAKAADVSKRVADSEAVAAGRDNASKKAAAAAAGLGAWLSSGRRGDALGIAPATKKRNVGWFLGLIGVGVGYGIGLLTAPKEGSELRGQIKSNAAGSRWDEPLRIDGDHGTLAPSGDPVLADKVRTRLGEDPRTSTLPSMNVNVVDGTVVLRGPRTDDTDEDAIREVVTSVDGVRDVDLELGSASR